MKIQKMFVMFLAIAILAAGMVSAANLKIDSLEINGHTVSSSDQTSLTQDYKRGDNLDLYICVEALADTYSGQLYADISGYTYAVDEPAKIHDMTDTFDLLQGHSDCFDMTLQVPTLIDKDYFKLRITGADRNGTSVDESYQLYLTGISRANAVEIKDFTLDPQSVQAGRAFTGKIKVHNLGNSKISDLKVTMSIPDLNIQVSDYMDSINADESKTFEDLLLRIPDCTKPGDYDVKINVAFDNFDTTQATGKMTVTQSTTCATSVANNPNGNTDISVPSNQESAQGTSIVYPIVIANNADSSKTYTLSVSGASTWSTTRIDPSSVVVVPAGQSRTAYLYMDTNANAELGDKTFTLNIDSNGESKSVPLVAKITQGSAGDAAGLRQALEIGLVVLVVILIIVGLVIGFSKMKNDNNRHDSEPYY